MLISKAASERNTSAPAMTKEIYLTKSRYTAGLQCLRRLWLNAREPLGWNEPELGSMENVGLEIGQMAHRLFPGGVLVKEAPSEHTMAAKRTAALMADRSVPAIFEAAFDHSGGVFESIFWSACRAGAGDYGRSRAVASLRTITTMMWQCRCMFSARQACALHRSRSSTSIRSMSVAPKAYLGQSSSAAWT
jgi:hypothetical protein